MASVSGQSMAGEASQEPLGDRVAGSVAATSSEAEGGWNRTIRPKYGLFDFSLREILHYKFLIYLFVRRDFVSQFKQTILGPLWFIIQPLFTTGIYSLIFGQFARIPTDSVPQPVFYMAGTTLWNYFSSCLAGTGQVFSANAGLFSKVYFPRLIVPITAVINRLFTFVIQMVLFLVIYFVYMARGANMKPNLLLLMLPVLVAHAAALGMAIGLISSALTVKYRDLANLVSFGVSLWMWATPIVYPMSLVPEKFRTLVYINPVSSIVELFRYGFTGAGTFAVQPYLLSLAVTVVLAGLALLVFHRAEQNFIDVA